MLGSLLGIMLLSGEKGDEHYFCCGSLFVRGFPGNSGNRFMLARILTTKSPLLAPRWLPSLRKRESFSK